MATESIPLAWGGGGLNLKAHANRRNKSQHYCVLLAVFGQECWARLHGPKSLTGFKLGYTHQMPTSANIVVVHANRDPTMLRVVVQQCCVRFHGP